MLENHDATLTSVGRHEVRELTPEPPPMRFRIRGSMTGPEWEAFSTAWRLRMLRTVVAGVSLSFLLDSLCVELQAAGRVIR